MGAVEVAVACQGGVTATAAPPPISAPSISRGLITTAHQETVLQNQGANMCSDDGPWDCNMYGCVGFLVLECAAAWECSAAQLRSELTW